MQFIVQCYHRYLTIACRSSILKSRSNPLNIFLLLDEISNFLCDFVLMDGRRCAIGIGLRFELIACRDVFEMFPTMGRILINANVKRCSERGVLATGSDNFTAVPTTVLRSGGDPRLEWTFQGTLHVHSQIGKGVVNQILPRETKGGMAQMASPQARGGMK